MIINIEVPQLSSVTVSFPRHWMNVTLLNNRAEDYRVHAIVSTFVRLTEAAFSQYELARICLTAFWNTHDRIAITDHNLAVSYFEACLNSMHRAALCMKQIRGSKHVPKDIKALFPSKPSFLADGAVRRLRRMRDMAQHMEEMVLKGEIAAGTSFSIRPDGLEAPVEGADQPNQTVKSIDRLVLGDEELLISDLVDWLNEMRSAAEQISTYERLVDTTGDLKAADL